MTDEGENRQPYFVDAYERYAAEFSVRPDVVIIKVGGHIDWIEQQLRRRGIPFHTFTFGGDYYALPNLVPFLSRPSRFELLAEILETPLPRRSDLN